jgi:hypothetical protein
MKTKMIIATAISLAVVFGLFFLTNELVTMEKWKWWTIPSLLCSWLIGLMGIFWIFELLTDSDDSKGEEDRRKEDF